MKSNQQPKKRKTERKEFHQYRQHSRFKFYSL